VALGWPKRHPRETQGSIDMKCCVYNKNAKKAGWGQKSGELVIARDRLVGCDPLPITLNPCVMLLGDLGWTWVYIGVGTPPPKSAENLEVPTFGTGTDASPAKRPK
jgi:hypothetical protein